MSGTKVSAMDKAVDYIPYFSSKMSLDTQIHIIKILFMINVSILSYLIDRLISCILFSLNKELHNKNRVTGRKLQKKQLKSHTFSVCSFV